MGRATEFYHYINQEEVKDEDLIMYTCLSITREIEVMRKKQIALKKEKKEFETEGLKLQSNGSFTLF